MLLGNVSAKKLNVKVKKTPIRSGKFCINLNISLRKQKHQNQSQKTKHQNHSVNDSPLEYHITKKGKAGLHRSIDLVQIDTLDHSRMNDDEVERTTSLAVTCKPTSLASVWNETERLVQCSSEYHLFHEIALSQSSIELLLRHYWWHICLGDEREHWSISVEQGSWSESLQQEVIWLADFKTYPASFSSPSPSLKGSMFVPSSWKNMERGWVTSKGAYEQW